MSGIHLPLLLANTQASSETRSPEARLICNFERTLRQIVLVTGKEEPPGMRSQGGVPRMQFGPCLAVADKKKASQLMKDTPGICTENLKSLCHKTIGFLGPRQFPSNCHWELWLTIPKIGVHRGSTLQS